MAPRKRIALIAHDHCKDDLLDWARYNVGTLSRHELSATGTTGALLSRELGLDVACYRSGPLGGDQQIGAAIVDGHVDFVIFFWDPLRPQPHDVDVKALLRIAVVYNIPIACNRATADFVLSSPLLSEPYDRLVSAVVTTPAAARPLAGGREGGVASARRHGSYGSGAPPADPAD
jgi:methylglyoxal synthase